MLLDSPREISRSERCLMSDNILFRSGDFPGEPLALLVNNPSTYACFLEINEHIVSDRMCWE